MLPVVYLFCSDIVLASSKRWQSDGTFDTAVPGFSQFYVIHAWYKEEMKPCVFALLSSKTEDLYKKMIRELKEAALAIRLGKG